MSQCSPAWPHSNIKQIFPDIFFVTGTNITEYDGVTLQHSRRIKTMQNNRSIKFTLFFIATAMSVGFIASAFAETCDEKSKTGNEFFEARWVANSTILKKKNYVECIYEINKEEYEFKTEPRDKHEYQSPTDLKIWTFNIERTEASCRSDTSKTPKENVNICSFVVKN